jgi:hypothetical protein
MQSVECEHVQIGLGLFHRLICLTIQSLQRERPADYTYIYSTAQAAYELPRNATSAMPNRRGSTRRIQRVEQCLVEEMRTGERSGDSRSRPLLRVAKILEDRTIKPQPVVDSFKEGAVHAKNYEVHYGTYRVYLSDGERMVQAVFKPV